MGSPRTQLYLHVGMPKTGTTYIQSVLHAGAEQLVAQGLALLPATRQGSFRLSVAVRGGRAGQPGVDAAVRRFARRLAQVETPRVLTSDEMLGGASSAQIAAFLEVCGDAEVHVVVSVRSLSRLLPSTWQQRVQQRSESPALEDFLAAVASREGALAERWWTERGVVPVLERWAEHVPMERMHVITMPGAGADPRSLLERHGSVLGVDVSVLDEDAARPNVSLGWAQAEVLRQVKLRVPRELHTRQGYLPVGKKWLGAGHLAPQRGVPPRMPSSLRAWCEEEAASTIDWLAAQPLEVAGDLADLCPQEEDFVEDPRLDADAIAEAAIAALTSIALERTREQS
ncbi:hypothetical protein [Nocardioides pyridinolyticus]